MIKDMQIESYCCEGTLRGERIHSNIHVSSIMQGRKSMFKHGGDNIGEKYTSCLWDVLRGALRHALLGGFGGMLPRENFLNGGIWCVLVYI